MAIHKLFSKILLIQTYHTTCVSFSCEFKLLFLYYSYTFLNWPLERSAYPESQGTPRQRHSIGSKASVAETLHDLFVRKGAKGCDDFFKHVRKCVRAVLVIKTKIFR